MTRIFDYAFKPLFLVCGASGIVLIALWLAFLNGLLPGFKPAIAPVYWHAHEMLLGFVGAAIGGFLLTAVANWTKRPPIQGYPLGLIVLAWLLGRIAMAYGATMPMILLTVTNSLYWLLLTALIGREIVLAGNHRNLVVVLLLLAFCATAMIFPVYPFYSARFAIALVCLMMMLIGGRIIPAFTTNWLKLNQVPGKEPQSFNQFDRLTMIATVPTLLAWAIAPDHAITGALLTSVAVMHFYRLSRWRGLATAKEPLLLALHLGYAWLPLGLLLLGIATFLPGLPTAMGIHSLTIGAMAAMILAVAVRATMGHSGAALTSTGLFLVALTSIHLAAIVRLASFYLPELILVSGLLWITALLCFLAQLLKTIFGRKAHPGEMTLSRS